MKRSQYKVTRTILCLYLFALPICCRAQSREIDSVKNLLTKATDDTSRVELLLSLANFLRGIEIERSKRLEYDALSLSVKIRFERGKIESLIGLASSYSRMGQKDTALMYNQQALMLAEKLNDTRAIAQSLNHLGVLARRSGEYDKAAALHRKALKIAEDIHDDTLLSYILKNLATLYILIRQYDYALEIFQYALTIATKIHDKEGMAIATGNIGFIYTELNQLDSALAYCKESLTLNEKLGNKRGMTIVFSQLATIYLRQKKFNQAALFAQQSLALGQRIQQEESEPYIILAFVAIEEKKYYVADSLFQLSLQKVALTGNPPYNRLSIYQGFYQLAKLQGNSKKALVWLEQSNQLSDSINSNERIKRINELQMRYDKQQNEEKIRVLQAERQVQIISFSIIVGITAVFVLILLRANRKRKVAFNKLTEAKNELEESYQHINAVNGEIERKNMQLQHNLDELRRTQTQLVQAEKMAALGTLVAGVAHELNTPIGVAVTAASTLQTRTRDFVKRFTEGGLKKSELEQYVQTADTGADLTLRNLERAANLIQSFKQVAVDQTRDDVREFRLGAYLQEIVTSLQPMVKITKHRIVLDVPAEVRMVNYPGALSQIITNLVQNALKHAFEGFRDDGTMTIAVSPMTDEQVTITFSDNGRGIPADIKPRIFDPFFTTKPGEQGGTGLGLHISYNLATQKMGGAMQVESEEGAGTTFIVQLPTIHLTDY